MGILGFYKVFSATNKIFSNFVVNVGTILAVNRAVVVVHYLINCLGLKELNHIQIFAKVSFFLKKIKFSIVFASIHILHILHIIL